MLVLRLLGRWRLRLIRPTSDALISDLTQLASGRTLDSRS